MVFVRFFTAADGAMCLQVRGHAGAGRRGRDPVCAGVSTVCRGLGRAAELLGEAGLLAQPPRVRLNGGRAEIAALPCPACRAETALVFWTAEVALHALAEAYPRNVTLEGVLQLERREENGK